VSGPEPAGPAQAPVLARIHAAAFPPAEAWGAAAIAALLATPGTAALLSGRAGMAMLRVAADEAEILTLAVRPAARRRGIGRGLLAATLRVAAEAGAARMLLEVAEANHAARSLYSAAGFAPVGRRPRYYPDGGDALLLARPLPAA
jgi:ribosomal-protein-alanine N-acetyltransferase